MSRETVPIPGRTVTLSRTLYPITSGGESGFRKKMTGKEDLASTSPRISQMATADGGTPGSKITVRRLKKVGPSTCQKSHLGPFRVKFPLPREGDARPQACFVKHRTTPNQLTESIRTAISSANSWESREGLKYLTEVCLRPFCDLADEDAKQQLTVTTSKTAPAEKGSIPMLVTLKVEL